MEERKLYHIRNMVTSKGNVISNISKVQPVLLVFLRHFGCTFCIQTLRDIKAKKEEIEKLGTRIVFVHMSGQETVETYFNQCEMQNAEHVSDPHCQFYTGFGLMKGNFRQIFGLTNWIKGFQNKFDRIKDENDLGDHFQMPGVFLIYNEKVLKSFIHHKISDRPDYIELASPN